MKKDLLSLWDLTPDDIISILDEAHAEKTIPSSAKPLSGKNVALVFEKASTRTKVSFSIAAYQLGAGVVDLEQKSSQLSRGETYADTARVLSQYVDGIIFRTFEQRNIEEMAAFATIPVINGLTDRYHPCQVLADLLTIREEKGAIEDLNIAWVGDGNNMSQSWMVAAAKLGFSLALATPKGREPSRKIYEAALESNSKIRILQDPVEAVAGADVINTDTWESMGQEGLQDVRSLFAPYQVTEELLQKASNQAIVLHCLPAHRGEEITDAVIDGEQSRVWQEAGNRLHVQKIILKRYLLS